MKKDKYPHAFQFLAGFFHQDFSEEFGEPEIAINKFIEDSNPRERAMLIMELQQIMSGASEDELDQAIFELGCYYSPQKHKGLTVTLWLTQVIAQLDASVKEAS